MTAQENLALVIRQSGDQKNNSARLIEESNRQADAVVAFLASDEVVLSAASAMADLSSDCPEASWADLWLAGVAACGVESLPREPEPWHAPDPVTTRNRVMRCDTCGKFRTAADMERRPVTQEDYLFGDPGPYFDCATCVNGRKSNG